MSQPTRSERRRQARGGSAPPPRRDPMRAVYIGAAAVMVALILGFLLYNWQQRRIVAQANATPTPGPNASAKPVQLSNGENLGVAMFKAKYPDTVNGGHGDPVDGVGCGAQEYATLHVHSHLALYDHGKQIAIPQFIGFAPTPTGGCLYWLHTHDASGIIHIESPQLAPNGSNGFTLGMLFDIWGEPLGPDGVAGIDGPVTAYVNGAKWGGDLRQIPLGAHQQIVLEVGTPIVPAPNYVFPADD